MDINLAIAENLKRLRKAQKMSIERTAETAGVSKSMLGQIERGEANPSVALLYKLSTALKVPMEELLRREETLEPGLFPALDAPSIRENGGKVLLHTQFSYDALSRMEQRRLDVFISGRYAPPPEIPGCVGYLLVTSGTLEAAADGELRRLEQWDGLRFRADRPFSFENNTTSAARAVLTLLYLK